ncbi:MAG: ribonuclease P protein component [Halothiobacillaceae bacterium]
METSFPKRVRLLRPAEFKNVFTDSLRVSRNGVVVLARRNELGFARLGLAVAKRHIKRAHERNRIKRLARETFRQHALRRCSMDCVLLTRTGVEQLPNGELRATLDFVWQRLLDQCNKS